MAEIIHAIEEVDNFVTTNEYLSFAGYKVTTNKNIYYVGIDNQAQCCESIGWLTSEDNLDYFINSEFLRIAVVDNALNEKIANNYEGNGMFVNVETSLGTLQFVVYNDHNGYYSHDAVVVTNATITHEQYL